jgi:hypothetical protein
VAFDFRSFAAAHEPWAFTDARGRTWTPARELSAPEAIRWTIRFERVKSLEDWYRVTSRLIRRLFPWHIKYWWSGDPAAAFNEMPIEARKAALDDLFRHRSRTTSTPRPSPNPTTTPKPSSADSPPIPTPGPSVASDFTRP